MEERSWNHRVVTIPIMILVTLFLVWASVSEVDEMVRGKGRVIPSSQTKIIQHLEGGIVEKIYVKEGQRVKKGDPLYRLKNEKSKADSKSKEISLYSLLAQKERLSAQIGFRDLNFSKDLPDDIINAQKAVFKEEMEKFESDLKALEDKLDQNRLQKKQKKIKLSNLRNELKTESENLNIAKRLLEKGAASRKQYLSELSKKQSLVTQINDLKNSLPIVEQMISESKNKIDSFKSERKSKWLKRLSEVDTKIKKLQEESLAGEEREGRKVVTSPVNGIVKKLYFHTIGGVVKPGDRIAEITPIDDKLIIEAKIKSSDRGQIVEGQKASIAITAYSYTKFGMLDGELLSISPDSFIDKNGGSFYHVKIKADKQDIAKDKPIMPGMVANVNIITGKKTIMRYILKPLKDITINSLHEQ
jgi:HlyD family secretion protein/adhesin transport system membrane fusion protein